MRAQRHPDADLARPPRDRISFDPVNSHHREQQCNSAEYTKENRAEPDDPQSYASLHEIGEGRDPENWQTGVETTQHLTQTRNGAEHCGAIFCRQSYRQEDTAVIGLSER